MTSFREFVHIPITPEIYDRANKMERAFFDKKGKLMGISESNHDYFIGLLGELALREYLRFNRVHHEIDDVLKSDFGDDFDVKINDSTFDVKTQKFNKHVFVTKHMWNNMNFMLYPQQVEKLLRKNIDYAYRVIVNVDYSFAHLIGYVKTDNLGKYEATGDIGEKFIVPFEELKAPHMIIYEYHEGII